jgi:hypothetical protein
MAIVVASNTALSTAAYTKTANLATGTYEFIGKGKITLVAKGSAVGMNTTLNVGGVALANDQVIPYTGTAGTLSINDNIVCSQVMNGGRIEFYLRNTTNGSLTCDFLLLFEPQ